MTVVDAIVVGGGLAGAAAAAHLAAAGHRVVLFEREARAHHKVCGEFLSGEAIGHLRALGLDPLDLGAAPIGAVRLAVGDRTAASALPFPACGLSRRVLDERLLARAAVLGADVRRGRPVRQIRYAAGRWQVDGAAAPALLLATGKHDLRGYGRPPERRSDLIGFKIHFRLPTAATADLAGTVEVHPYDGGYAGLQQVEGERANFCLLVRRDVFAGLDRRWDRLVARLGRNAPLLGARLDGAQPLIERPLAVSGVPYGHVHVAPPTDEPPGLYRLGDQFAVIPSFAGDGMAIALHSARLAADMVMAGEGSTRFHKVLQRDVQPRVRDAGLLARAAERPAGQRLIMTACRVAPPLMAWLAVRTRMPARLD